MHLEFCIVTLLTYLHSEILHHQATYFVALVRTVFSPEP
jgi:hypothetical protein